MTDTTTATSPGVVPMEAAVPDHAGADGAGDRVLTTWAADSVARALADFGEAGEDERAQAALAAARSWAHGEGDVDACRDAAFEAQLAARDTHDDGYRALAIAFRAAASLAASVDDSRLATDAAGLAVEAIAANSAPCEQDFNTGSERRRQWQALPEALRPSVLGSEPPDPAPAACAI